MPANRTNTSSLVIAISMALSCCSEVIEPQVEPNIAEAQAVIQTAVSRNSEGRFKLISLQKTGGRRVKVGDKDTYELWYNATLELTQDTLWSPLVFKRFSTLSPAAKGSFSVYTSKAGEQVTIAGTLTFTKEKDGGRWTAQPDDRYQ